MSRKKRMCEMDGWEKVVEKGLTWPETNIPAREVYQKYGLGEYLIYRFNMLGEEIYNNEDKFSFSHA